MPMTMNLVIRNESWVLQKILMILEYSGNDQELSPSAEEMITIFV